MKLRSKILLILLPLTVTPLFVIGWIAYGELMGVSRDKAFEEMNAVIRTLKHQSNDQINNTGANIELFSTNISVRKYILTQSESERYSLLQNPLLRTFRGFQDAFPDYYEMRILLPDGYEDIRLSNRDIKNTVEEEHDNPMFIAMQNNGNRITQRVFRNPDDGKTALFIGKPLVLRDPAVDPIDAPPTLRGYLAITVALDSLRQQIENSHIGKTGYLLATDAQGNRLFASAKAPSGQFLSPEVRSKILNRPKGAVPVSSPVGDNHAYISGTRLLPDLYLFAVLPSNDLLSDSLKLGAVVAAITLLTVLLTTAALYLALQHFIIRPVQRLQLLTKEIGRGKLDVVHTLDSNDEIGELADAFTDMAGSLRQSDEQIRFIAYHDNLTGLPNRAMFGEYLNRVIAESARKEKQFALLFIDIDDFKRVNDTLGHQAGDQLLQAMTERLNRCLRKADYVARMDHPGEPDELLARLGGDEFVILMPDINGSHAPSTLANRLLAILAEPFTIGGHDFYIGASIGITLFPSDGEDAETLTKNADIAMYHAKAQGKNDYRFYLNSMNVLAHERLALENKLRKALTNHELSLYYQPQVDALTGEIVGMEALIRWDHSEDGKIPPSVFIPVAEETGLILEIGEWVINEACRQNRVWQKDGLPNIPVSVNVSGHQFGKQGLSRFIDNALRRNNLKPELLEVEITESAIMENPERAVKELESIKALGVSIALDDFGTGYSSFSYLHRFPIDTLKIDQSFIQSIDETHDRSELVAAIIAMAHILNLDVVAEGIETERQLDVLTEKKCDTIQGFLFMPPVPANHIPSLLKQRILKRA